MAGEFNKKKVILFGERLRKLECTITDGLEEELILELVSKPDEVRYKLLQWLFIKFDDSFTEILYANIQTEKSIINNLLLAASAIGLCTPEDIDLIKGTCSQNRQLKFIDMLLDMVCIVDKSRDQSSSDISPMINKSSFSSLEDNYEQAKNYMNTLCENCDVENILGTDVKFLPLDITKAIKKSNEENKPSSQSFSMLKLKEMSDELSNKLVEQNKILSNLDLENEESIFKNDKELSKVLDLTLMELSSLVEQFSQVFENEILFWSKREYPHLNDLGTSFQKVYIDMKVFTELLDSISIKREKYIYICTNLTLKMDSIKKEENRRLKSLAEIGHESLNSFKDCVEILQDSILQTGNQYNPSSCIPLNGSIIKFI